MLPIDENTLLIAFIVFAIFVVLGAFFLRRMTVDDILRDGKSSSPNETAFDKKAIKPLSSKPTTMNSNAGTPTTQFSRENINKFAKLVAAVGAILIFAPLPDSMDGVGLGVAFIGYLLTRATNPPKEPSAKRQTTQSSFISTLRKLASKPEYREAMQILSADMADKNLLMQAEQRARAIRYLESKGVSREEANKNIVLLAEYIAQQNKK